jgi:hypothetical protein
MSTRFCCALCVVASAMALGACGKDLPAGASTMSTAQEAADDGDDSDGPVDMKSSPERIAHDGQAIAISAPIDYRQYLADTNAQVGSMANRIAQAEAKGTITSHFEVDRLWRSETVNIAIHTVLEGRITSGMCFVNSSVGLITVPGGAAAMPLQHHVYRLTRNTTVPRIDITLDGNPLTTVPQLTAHDDIQTFSVKVSNGQYQLTYDWDVECSADGRAEVVAHGYLVAS